VAGACFAERVAVELEDRTKVGSSTANALPT